MEINFTKLIAYQNGELTANETKDIEEQLAIDTDLQEQLQLLTITKSALNRQKEPILALDALKASLKEAADEYKNSAKTAEPLNVRALPTPIAWLKVAAIAASIVLTIGIGSYFYLKPSTLSGEELYATHFKNAMPAQMSGNDAAIQDAFQNGKTAFNNHDFKTAAAEFEKVVAAEPNNMEVAEDLVRTYIEAKEFVKAENLLKTLEKKPNNAVLWLRAGNLLAQGKKEEAKVVLQKLIDTNARYTIEAQEIINY